MATADEINSVIETLARNTNGAERFAEEDFARMHRAWSDMDARALMAAADRHINKSSFFPTLADMNRLIDTELKIQNVARIEEEIYQPPTLDELFEWAVMEAELKQPSCERCAGCGGVVKLGQPDEMPFTQYSNFRMDVNMRQLYDSGVYQKCPDCGGSGREPLSEHEVAQLRARVFNQPQEIVLEKVRVN